MIVRHVIIGAVFTVAGLVSLLTPEVPFICIGALVFGPIELLFGLFSQNPRDRARAAYMPSPSAVPSRPWQTPAPLAAPRPTPDVTTLKFCPHCGAATIPGMAYCANCGALLPQPPGTGTKG